MERYLLFKRIKPRLLLKKGFRDSAFPGSQRKKQWSTLWNDLISPLSRGRRKKLPRRRLKLLSCPEGRCTPPSPRVKTSVLAEADVLVKLAVPGPRLWAPGSEKLLSPRWLPSCLRQSRGNEKKELHLVLLQNKTKGILNNLPGEQTHLVSRNITLKSQKCWVWEV